MKKEIEIKIELSTEEIKNFTGNADNKDGSLKNNLKARPCSLYG